MSPQPIDAQKAFAPEHHGFDGPVIEISERRSDQNGDRLDKAKIIARVFPAYKALVTELMDGFDSRASSYPSGAYQSEILTYRSKTVVEYETPAHMEGLGTHSSLKKNGSPIEGVAILNGESPDLVLLSVRLPKELHDMTPVIVHQVEREVAARKQLE